MEAKLSSDGSFIWRSVMWGRDLLKEGLRWRIGDGRTVRVFGDAWLPTLPNGVMLQNQNNGEKVYVADLLDETNQWNVAKMSKILLPIEREEVMKVDAPKEGYKDVRYWKYDPKGEYSVKSGYLVASKYFDSPNYCSEDGNVEWWRYIWSFDLPQRVRIFGWRVFRNIIPTEMNLYHHHVPVDGRCGWCKTEWGTTSHVLLLCDKVRKLWATFDFWNFMKKREGWDMKKIGEAMKSRLMRENFERWLMGMWLVWKGLCDERFKEKRLSWGNLKQESDTFIEGYCKAKQQAACQKRIMPLEGSHKWKNPKRGRFRLDVDYAADEGRGCGGVEAIARNAEGGIIFALAKPVAFSATVLHGELRAVMHGVCQSIEDELSPVEVYSDSILAVHVINESEASHSVLCEDMAEFFLMVKSLNVISVNHVRREANKAAHELASLAKNLDSAVLWHDNWPSWLTSIVSSNISN